MIVKVKGRHWVYIHEVRRMATVKETTVGS